MFRLVVTHCSRAKWYGGRRLRICRSLSTPIEWDRRGSQPLGEVGPSWAGGPACSPVLLEEASEVAVLTQPVAVAPDADKLMMMDQPVVDGGRQEIVPEDLAPMRGPSVARANGGRVLVAAEAQRKRSAWPPCA